MESDGSGARRPCPPTGRQFEIRHGDQRAVAVELGGALRVYELGDRPVLAGFGEDEPARGGRGAVLVPWPNRIEDGRYRFAGVDHQLPRDDLTDGHAIHGLLRWTSWTPVTHERDSVTLQATVFPRPGYPFTLAVAVRYRLSGAGLAVTTVVRNSGENAAPVGLGHHPYLAVGSDRIDDAILHVPARSWSPTGDRRLPGPLRALEGEPTDFRAARRIGSVVLSGTFTELERDTAGRAWVTVDGTRAWLDRAYQFVLVFSGEDLPDEAEHRRSLAVEPMTCPPNAFRTGVGLRILAPGQRLRARWGIAPKGLPTLAPVEG